MNNIENSNFFFMHIPKTGGTTFRHLLYNYYSSENVFPSQKQLRQKFSGQYPKGSEFINILKLSKDNYKVVCGHYPYRIVTEFINEYKTITFIRNPMDRFMSHLGHVARKSQIKDINELFDLNWKRIARVQTNFFGFNNQKPNWKEVNTVIENISFIGINEQFELSVELLNKLFELEIKVPEKSKNVANAKLSYDMLSTKNRIELIRNLGPDINLYNKCLKKFNAQINMYL